MLQLQLAKMYVCPILKKKKKTRKGENTDINNKGNLPRQLQGVRT